MSIGNGWRTKDTTYSDGITKITDPFWINTCRKCAHVFMSCIATTKCPKCGSAEADRRLGNIPYEQIIAERGEPISE